MYTLLFVKYSSLKRTRVQHVAAYYIFMIFNIHITVFNDFKYSWNDLEQKRNSKYKHQL
jgi:hypothetical protein